VEGVLSLHEGVIVGKVLIVYFSASGTTEKMAQHMAEGVRIAGHEADVKSISDIGDARDLSGYDAYIFGSSTYHLGIPEPFEAFFAIAERSGLAGKIGGAFSSRTHPSSSETSVASLIFDRMESAFRMKMTSLGPFDLKPEWFEDSKPALIDRSEWMRACQEYGKVISEMLVNKRLSST
jgi:flavodoxin